jgi:hypothetical protein
MRRHGYPVVSLDASGWAADENLHRDIAAALDCPDYYGRNLDALNDCVGDVVDYPFGTTRVATDLLLTFAVYDAFARKRPRTAWIVLDIIADQAGRAMLQRLKGQGLSPGACVRIGCSFGLVLSLRASRWCAVLSSAGRCQTRCAGVRVVRAGGSVRFSDDVDVSLTVAAPASRASSSAPRTQAAAVAVAVRC